VRGKLLSVSDAREQLGDCLTRLGARPEEAIVIIRRSSVAGALVGPEVWELLSQVDLDNLRRLLAGLPKNHDR